MLDAIWVSLLEDTEMVQTDSHGRQRVVKAGKKVCVLVALGLYPQNGDWHILGWLLAASEEQPAWEQLLLPLEQRGLFRERGLELLIHDGGKGLIAALNYIYPHVPHQRCWFHKLCNLRQAIHPPAGLSSAERRLFKQAITQQIRPIVELPSAQAAQSLRDELCAFYQDTQPKLVATLQRDWHETIAFFRVLARYPDWPRKYLRTTSLLERVNRMIRRLFRTGGAFHSSIGVLAAVDKVLSPKLLF
jgi:transposase-like protein